MKNELKKIFDTHKAKLDTIKENRANEGDSWSEAEARVVDEYIVGLASVLSDINQLLTASQEIETHNISQLRYTGGNNGGEYAEFLFMNGFLNTNRSFDDYFTMASRIKATYVNFRKWIMQDDFWVDFGARAVELGMPVRA